MHVKHSEIKSFTLVVSKIIIFFVVVFCSLWPMNLENNYLYHLNQWILNIWLSVKVGLWIRVVTMTQWLFKYSNSLCIPKTQLTRLVNSKSTEKHITASSFVYDLVLCLMRQLLLKRQKVEFLKLVNSVHWHGS